MYVTIQRPRQLHAYSDLLLFIFIFLDDNALQYILRKGTLRTRFYRRETCIPHFIFLSMCVTASRKVGRLITNVLRGVPLSPPGGTSHKYVVPAWMLCLLYRVRSMCIIRQKIATVHTECNRYTKTHV